MGRTKTFGGIPGDVEPYAIGSLTEGGAVYTVLNPAQGVREIEFPVLSRALGVRGEGKIIFRDAGFTPILRGNRITLGPGELAAVGFGRYASKEYDLGIQEDVQIPRSIAPLDAKFLPTTRNTIETSIAAPAKGNLRIIFQQHG